MIFSSNYDRYISFFNREKDAVADGEIYNNVKDPFVANIPFFIQYSGEKSMNNHYGYILYGDHDMPPDGFESIDKILHCSSEKPVLIWSNGTQYADVEEYKTAIDKVDLAEYCSNMFINTCIPLQANEAAFK